MYIEDITVVNEHLLLLYWIVNASCPFSDSCYKNLLCCNGVCVVTTWCTYIVNVFQHVLLFVSQYRFCCNCPYIFATKYQHLNWDQSVCYDTFDLP
jgi:hypothetical protein